MESILLPIVPFVTFILLFSLLSIMDAPPVTVNVAVFLFGPPYSVGYLNVFSDVLLWDTVVISVLILSLSINTDPNNIPSILVAQAEYIFRCCIICCWYLIW